MSYIVALHVKMSYIVARRPRKRESEEEDGKRKEKKRERRKQEPQGKEKEKKREGGEERMINVAGIYVIRYGWYWIL